VADLVRLHLRELRWLSTGRCCAAFKSDQGETFEATFEVDRQGGITLVIDEANLMGRFDGSAEELRTVNRAVAAFCDAAT